MKMTNWKLATLAMAVTLFAFTSCSDNDEPNNGAEGCRIDLNRRTHQRPHAEKAVTPYYLSGGYHVKSGTTPTIQPGVNIIPKTMTSLITSSLNKEPKLMRKVPPAHLLS